MLNTVFRAAESFKNCATMITHRIIKEGCKGHIAKTVRAQYQLKAFNIEKPRFSVLTWT